MTGRSWQEARRRPLREAVAVGGARAASAITVAGIVLALSFALLALVPVRFFRELAFFMSVGLLVDAFLVRTLLVPSLIALIGPVSGWPGGRLRHRAPPPASPTVSPASDGRLAGLAQTVVMIGVIVGALAGLSSRRRER